MDERAGRLDTGLLTALRRDAGGGAMILAGEGDLLPAALQAAAAMECGQRPSAPCGTCLPCRKVLAGVHPDVTVVRDEAHKLIAMDVLRALRSDAYLLPNEGRRKVYIFPDCALLDGGGQNVLLKVLEEGPAHAVFLFCARNAGELLPTVRSRCSLWRLGGGEGGEAPDSRASELCLLLARGDRTGLAAFFTALETGRCSREELQGILSRARDVTAEALLLAEGCALTAAGEEARAMAKGLAPPQLSALADLLGEQGRQLRFNLNVGHAAGALSVRAGEVLRRGR